MLPRGCLINQALVEQESEALESNSQEGDIQFRCYVTVKPRTEGRRRAEGHA